MKHLSPDRLGRLAALAVDREELGAAAWHLYRCGRCRHELAETSSVGSELLAALFRDLEPRDEDRVEEHRYGRAFDAARRRAVARGAVAEAEKRDARDGVAELVGLDPSARRERVLRNPRLHSWAFTERLLQVHRDRLRDDPAEAEGWVRLALDAAAALRARRDAFRPGDELIADLEARVLAQLGTCLRVQSRLREADLAIDDAEARLERGTGDRNELAFVLESRASLRRAQRRFAEALELTERAVYLYRRLGETSRLAGALVNRATLESYLDRGESALGTLGEALGLIDPEREPALWMSASYNLATALHEAGRPVEAAEKLAAVRPHLEALGGATDRAKLRWFEGIVARDGGDPARAERLLVETRDEFARLGLAYEIALVSLDLAALYLAEGRTAETRRLAESMLPVFRSRDIHREATAALLLFHRAALAETATASLAAEVAATVRRGGARGPRPADGSPS